VTMQAAIEQKKSAIKETGIFLAHMAGSWLGIPAVAAFGTLSEITPGWGRWILTETPFFPVQILLGLVLGFWLSRRFGHRVMLWTWTIPALILAGAILFEPPGFLSGGLPDSSRFFGEKCLPQNRCFDQLIFTMPFYSAAAYSLGALFARLDPRKARATHGA
jgi:hypothetical protein